MGGCFMEKKRKTYDIPFKRKVVDLHLKKGVGYNAIAKELGIDKIRCEDGSTTFKLKG